MEGVHSRALHKSEGLKLPARAYAKPPITEAVIDATFEGKLPPSLLEKQAHRLARHYPTIEQKYDIEFELAPVSDAEPPKPVSRIEKSGFKLTTSDQVDVVLLSAGGIGTSRLAPYCGWEPFRDLARRNYDLCKEISGVRRCTRVATRYINRLDIPVEGRQRFDEAEYIRIGPRLPRNDMLGLNGYLVTVEAALPEIRCGLRIASASVPPAILDHASILLDIDLYRTDTLPQRDDDLWEIFETLHVHKNRIFEECITDRARELFDRA